MTSEAAQDWRSRNTVTVEEAGSILGIGRSSAYALARSGELVTLRLGRRFIVPVAALRRMLGELDPFNESTPAGKPGLTKTAAGDGHHESYDA